MIPAPMKDSSAEHAGRLTSGNNLIFQRICINDPIDNSFPLGKEIFENRQVVYHGTCSSYSASIESSGLEPGGRPFNVEPLIAISDALKAIGEALDYSPLASVPAIKKPNSECIFFAPNFWGARSYATLCGGEDLDAAVKDAQRFERICVSPKARMERIERWQNAMRDAEKRWTDTRRSIEDELRTNAELQVRTPWLANDEPEWQFLPKEPDFRPTISAIEVLKDDNRMESMRVTVANARENLQLLTNGGYPVVYAVRVEPEWFGEQWGGYLGRWRNGESTGELVCSQLISPDRLAGAVTFPNGTDASFSPSCYTKWAKVEELNRQQMQRLGCRDARPQQMACETSI